MNPAVHSLYQENQILSATPLELIGLMLGKASRDITKGSEALAGEDAIGHAQAIGKASRIICELRLSLDHENGKEISRNLWRVYDYVSSVLTDPKSCKDQRKLQQAAAMTGSLAETFMQANTSLQTGGGQSF